MPKAAIPTVRLTKAYWQAQVNSDGEAYLVDDAERWIPGTHFRRDGFGFADLYAIRSDQSGVLAIQVCAVSDLAAHRAKILGSQAAYVWACAGNRIGLMGWERPKELNLWSSKTTLPVQKLFQGYRYRFQFLWRGHFEQLPASERLPWPLPRKKAKA